MSKMRSKSAKDVPRSPKIDPVKRSDGRQSLQRHNRSYSRSSDESEEDIHMENEQLPEEVLNIIYNVDRSGGSLKQVHSFEKSYSMDSPERGEQNDREEEVKGKSKDINKTNIEPLPYNVEPEIENDHVQGTQSPSKDTENVQNLNDTPQANSEEAAVINEVGEAENKDTRGGKIEAIHFDSEYSLDMKPASEINQDGEKSQKGSSNDKSESCDERSTTPEIRDKKIERIRESSKKQSSSVEEKNAKSEKSSSHESGKEKGVERKRIKLRRSPAKKEKEQKDKTTSHEIDEAKGSKDKVSKKISLKRHTTEDRIERDEKEIEEKESKRRSSAHEQFTDRRRLSSLTEDSAQDIEVTSKTNSETPKRASKKIKLLRNFSQDAKEPDEKLTKERKQRWGKSEWLNKLPSTLHKVDVETIKVICPTVKLLDVNETTIDLAPRPRIKSESEMTKRKISTDKSEDESDKQTSEDSSDEQKVEPNVNIIAMNRKISIVDDMASKLKPPPSPPKQPVSQVLFITNLVRPFTVKQLKELLERTGKIREDGFWTDRIKSKCYVYYESVEEAEATRNALHGVNWPIGNGKKLIIDYSTVEEMKKARNPVPVPPKIPETLPEKENREPEKVENKFKEREREKEERRKRDGHARDWDKTKEEVRKRTKSKERVRKHSRRSYTPLDYPTKRQRKVEEPVPQKLMDDLFLKTKATPSIYWQPLSPEEIAAKQKQRLLRMEEHKRRIEETRGRVRETRRVPFRRR